jgi:hypothetical protein
MWAAGRCRGGVVTVRVRDAAAAGVAATRTALELFGRRFERSLSYATQEVSYKRDVFRNLFVNGVRKYQEKVDILAVFEAMGKNRRLVCNRFGQYRDHTLGGWERSAICDRRNQQV